MVCVTRFLVHVAAGKAEDVVDRGVGFSRDLAEGIVGQMVGDGAGNVGKVVEGAEVSAVLRDEGALVVRVFNASPEPSIARVARGADPASGDIVDLRGRVTGTFSGDVELRPWEITTLRLAD